MKDRFRSTGGLRSQTGHTWMGTVRVTRGGGSARGAARARCRGGEGSQSSRGTTHVRD